MGRESRERGNSLEGCCEHCSKSCAENYAPCLSVSNSPDAPLVKGTMTRATKMIGRLIMLAVSVQERAKGESKQRGSWRTVIILVLLRVHIPSPPPPLNYQPFFPSCTARRGGRFFGFFEKKPVFQGDYFGGNSFLARYCSRSCFATRFERKRGEIPWRSLTQQTFPLLSCRTN